MNLSVLHALGIADCAVLKRIDESRFELQEYAGAWLTTLFPSAKQHDIIIIDDSIIFLCDFLIDAEAFWQAQYPGQVKSGIWTEQIGAQPLFLEAYASCIENDKFLIIKNAEQTYFERKETLQIARELSLSNSQVIERHDYLSQRLRTILQDEANNENRLPLHEAIRYANIGIIIIDRQQHVVESNPAAFSIFEHISPSDNEQLLTTVKSLVLRQYPEKSLFVGTKPWQGELYWHMPPLATRWLNMNINPVISSSGQLSHWIISINDQTRIKHLLQTNEELALHDPLTGLPNRQYFWQELQQSITLGGPFYLISIDIVNFKYANELYGYLEGDELLKQIAKRLTRELAENDFITRNGADEFMIIRKIDNASLRLLRTSFDEDVHNFAAKLLSVCSQPYFTQDDRRCDLPIKIGMTQYPADAVTAETLLNNADLALSHSKITANTSIQIYNEELKNASARRIMLEEALKNAIINKEFELYLQPIYDINTNQIVKAEALIRWKLNSEMIMPYEFIPIAESSNVINAIGRWVIRKTCKIALQLKNNKINIPISLNFSPNQIYDLNLVDFIRTEIEVCNIDATLLELEVTEGVLVKNYEKVSAFLHEIKRQGISISVDDFGTGYCSLAYLKHLPIDTLKIDKAFISEIDTNEDDSAIVSAIIALAKQLKLGIVAEGIETQAQKDFLITLDCSRAQGFYYNRPMPVKDFVELCSDKNI
jgi:diguanylate cyclase (GGDEF)-like protein